MFKPDRVSADHKAALTIFLSNPEGDQHARLLVETFLLMWEESLNELIEESDARNVSQFSNEIRRVATEYGFRIDASGMVSADLADTIGASL